MIKKIIILLFVLLLVGTGGVFASEQSNTLGELTDEIYDKYDIGSLEQIYERAGLEKYLHYTSVKDFISALVKGELEFSLSTILEGVKSIFFQEISLSLGLLAQIIFLSILAAVLNNISSSFGESQVGNIAFYVIYFVLIGLIASSFQSSISLASSTIDEMVSGIQAIIPALILLLASVGAIASSAVLSPVIVYVVTFVGTTINNVIYPLILASAVITLIDHLSKEVKLSNLSKLLKDIALYILGFLFILFLGVISIQGFAMTTLDGVSSKTAKYAIDNFVPFVGGFLADSMDTIVSAASLIKNGVGIIGLLVIVGIIAFPIMKMFVLSLMFKISAAIIQPISDERIVKCLADIGTYIMLILSCLLVVAVMFFLMISIVVLLGDMTVMYR